jgi:hypothetical protein
MFLATAPVLLLASLPLTPTSVADLGPTSAHIAFRVDGEHAVAVISVFDDTSSQKTPAGLSAEPDARYGFRYFDATDAIHAKVPPALRSAREWRLHVAPGQTVRATADRLVGGTANCLQAAAVLLEIPVEDAPRFRAASAKYFVAEPRPPADPIPAGSAVPAGALAGAALSAAQTRQLEALLNDLLKRELPAILEETRPEISRMASSPVDYHRTWAAARRAADDELARGNVRLLYDVQSFGLDPRGGTTYFVRARWLAGGTPAFATSVWVRGDPLQIVEADTAPASWLRTFEFQNEIDTVQLGLVLNVIDQDGDGWAEIIFARGGYESLEIGVLEFSPEGLVPRNITFTAGC